MSFKRHLSAVVLAGVLAQTASAQTHTTYTYTADWTYWADNAGINRPLYAGLDGRGIKFEFTTAAPLSLVGCGTGGYSIYCQASIVPLSWHYNGGSSFLDLGSDVAGSSLTLLLSTDAAGNILNDRFYLNGQVVIPTLEQYLSYLSEAHDGYDQQTLSSTFTRFYGGSQSYIPLSEGFSNNSGAGSWTFVTTPDISTVPEPETYSLMLAGLGLVSAIARRRKAKPAA
jgi:hypothetical protein